MSNLSKKAAWKKYYVTNEQVLSLIAIWKEASPRMKPKIQSVLIERLTYLIYTKIQGYKSKSFYGDLIQEGKLGLLKAMQDFNPDRCPNFFNFAIWHIRNRVRYYMRYQQRFEKGVKQNLNDDFQVVPDPQECYEEEEGKKMLENVLNRLPEIEGRVVMMRFGIGGTRKHTFQQIGDMLSVSRQYVQQIESRAILKLKKNQEIKDFYKI